MENKTIYVKCPRCEHTLEVNSQTGEVLKSYEALRKAEGTGDRFSEALKKLEKDKEKLKDKFEHTKEELEARKKKAAEIFDNEVKRVKAEGGKAERPVSPFDLD